MGPDKQIEIGWNDLSETGKQRLKEFITECGGDEMDISRIETESCICTIYEDQISIASRINDQIEIVSDEVNNTVTIEIHREEYMNLFIIPKREYEIYSIGDIIQLMLKQEDVWEGDNLANRIEKLLQELEVSFKLTLL